MNAARRSPPQATSPSTTPTCRSDRRHRTRGAARHGPTTKSVKTQPTHPSDRSLAARFLRWLKTANKLRKLCNNYQSNVVFTTHSLAMIRMLQPGELRYFSLTRGEAAIEPSSFGYVNSVLYGFRGWDRYILTEDDVLKEFLEYVITHYCPDAFHTCLVIYVGGAGNVTDMLDQNAQEQFLAQREHVIAVLDGDQRGCRRARHERTFCIPLESVEKALLAEYGNPDFPHRLADDSVIGGDPKKLFKELSKQGLMSRARVYEFLCNRHHAAVQAFSRHLAQLLGSAPG